MNAPKIPAFRAQATIRNLGAIREAHLDLRPLTVLFGHNGVNKTWAANAVVGAMGDFPQRLGEFSAELSSLLSEFVRKTQDTMAMLRQALERERRVGRGVDGRFQPRRFRVPMDIEELFHRLRKELVWRADVEDIARRLGVSSDVLAQVDVSISDVSVVRVSPPFRGLVVELLPTVDRERVEHENKWGWGDGFGDARRMRAAAEDLDSMTGAALEIKTPESSAVLAWPAFPLHHQFELDDFLLSSLIGSANRGWAWTMAPFFLPAERKAIAMFIRHLDAVSELQGRLGPGDVRLADGRDLSSAIGVGRAMGLLRDSPPFPTPVQRLAGWLAGASTRSAGADSATYNRAGALPDLGRQLTGILKGQVTFGDLGAGAAAIGYGTAPLVFRFGDGKELPFQAAASLARSLGLLDIWLREQAEPGDLVLIDEPEMNAHPETQVKIAELLAMLVNAGLRVIITTHSPYLVEHLEGLMLGSRLDPEARARFVDRLALKDEAAWLDPEDLAVYHFEEQADGEVKVQDVLNRQEASIDWTTFSRPIAFVGNLINNILAELGEGDTE